MRANPDPFDVEPLERSVNDSAVRVSAIWVSFVIFGLYLVIAAVGATHRQLLLEEPIELPVFKISLPLVGFFVLAPILFVFFHAYVLVQVLLLARTAAAYDEAVQHTFSASSDGDRIRQRLANTLFAQIFAGSAREREGVLGALLRLTAWLTLSVAPVLVLLTFEVQFLPYHSWVTWTHRGLIAIDLVILLVLWRAALDATRDVTWRIVFEHRPALLTASGLLLISLLVVTYPGEFHSDWLRFGGNCNRLLWFGPFNDRISLLEERLIDTEKLAQVENAIGLHEVEPIIPEATRRFRRRNLVCGEFSLADLRRADFTDADMRGARLIGALLDGATLSGTRLENATLYGTKLTGAKLEATALQGADLRFAHLNGARINFAKLQGANLDKARLGGAQLLSVKLQGANLTNAHLEGAFLWDAQLQGSNLSEARLQGALLIHPELQGANLSGARLQGAIVSEGQLQGANLSKAQLGGTGLFGAQLQGALLDESSLTLTAILQSSVWRATGAKCDDAYVHEPKLEPLFEESETITSGIERFIEQVVRDTPQETKQKVQITLRERLILDTNDDRTNEQLWRACQAKASTDDYDIRHAGYLADLVCNDAYYDVPWDINIGLDAQQRQYLARGIFAQWIRHLSLENAAAQAFARRVLGPDGQPCRGAREIGEEATQRLRKLMRNKLDP